MYIKNITQYINLLIINQKLFKESHLLFNWYCNGNILQAYFVCTRSVFVSMFMFSLVTTFESKFKYSSEYSTINNEISIVLET